MDIPKQPTRYYGTPDSPKKTQEAITQYDIEMREYLYWLKMQKQEGIGGA